jgi:hypothetical protein
LYPLLYPSGLELLQELALRLTSLFRHVGVPLEHGDGGPAKHPLDDHGIGSVLCKPLRQTMAYVVEPKSRAIRGNDPSFHRT